MIRTVDNCVGDQRARDAAEFNLRIYREFLYFTGNDLNKRRDQYLTQYDIKLDRQLIQPTISVAAAQCVAKHERDVRALLPSLLYVLRAFLWCIVD